MDNKNCACDTAPKQIFSCCGSADVGEIADLAARKLHREGVGKMYCLTGIGAGLSGFIESTKAAAKILTVDGCPVDCAKKLLEKHGISGFEWFRLTDLGMEKGKTPIDDRSVESAAAKGRELLKGASS
jgi:uncharacterized metal-binding protein